MAGVEETLRDLMCLDGVIGASIVDYFSRFPLGIAEGVAGPDLVKAAYADTDVVRAKLSALELLGYRVDQVEDILITLDCEYHLIHPLSRRSHQGVFVYLVLDRQRTDLGAVRSKLWEIELRLEL